MADWDRTKQADLALRAGGLVLCATSYSALSRLVAFAPAAPERGIGLLGSCLATIGFLAASAGTALMFLGAHLFDRVEVSARWRRLNPAYDRRIHDEPIDRSVVDWLRSASDDRTDLQAGSLTSSAWRR